MISKKEVEKKEEEIRQRLRDLPDEKRKEFYELSNPKIKDPDTYATLVYILILGLHHIYLKRWTKFLIVFGALVTAIIALGTGYVGLGGLILLCIIISELHSLFRSQVIVQDYNNKIMEKTYDKIIQTTNQVITENIEEIQ